MTSTRVAGVQHAGGDVLGLATVWISTSAGAAGLPLPVPTRPGPTVALTAERGAEEPAQWAVLRGALGVEGAHWRMGASVPGAVVVDGHGARAGLAEPQLSVALAPAGPLSGGLQVGLPVGTPDVARAVWRATPLLGSTVSVGGMRVGAQAAWTWTPRAADPVALSGPDPATLAHGAEPLHDGTTTDGGRAPEPHGHVDPAHRNQVHGRAFVGPSGAAFAVAVLDVRHAPDDSAVELGVAWVGAADRVVRPHLQLSAPVWSTGSSGLQLSAGVELRRGRGD